MNALKANFILLFALAAVPTAALDAEQTRVLDAYLAQQGVFDTGPAAPNIDLEGRAHTIGLQLERVTAMVAKNTEFVVTSLGQLARIEIKLRKPSPLVYDDARTRREIRDQAVSECCARRQGGTSQ